ncbi:C69 family dipeptidase [Clostridium oryzae]|uniref:C69 family dipeptidase n=1 Tax=Clostridium oryzae TaxID=1450648 RepID=UPI001A9A529D|nr:C69 family dipeptidase [Clostridium oryzae]
MKIEYSILKEEFIGGICIIKKRFLSKIIVSLLALGIASPALNSFACTTVIVGKGATKGGSTIIARNEDDNPTLPKHFVVRLAKDNVDGAKYISKVNNFTCELPKHQYKYTCTPQWDENSANGQFEEDGINEKGVAMSSTESTYSNKNVLSVDPFVSDGIKEDSMLTVVLPYINSAREGVQRLGDIVTNYLN